MFKTKLDCEILGSGPFTKLLTTLSVMPSKAPLPGVSSLTKRFYKELLIHPVLQVDRPYSLPKPRTLSTQGNRE